MTEPTPIVVAAPPPARLPRLLWAIIFCGAVAGVVGVIYGVLTYGSTSSASLQQSQANGKILGGIDTALDRQEQLLQQSSANQRCIIALLLIPTDSRVRLSDDAVRLMCPIRDTFTVPPTTSTTTSTPRPATPQTTTTSVRPAPGAPGPSQPPSAPATPSTTTAPSTTTTTTPRPCNTLPITGLCVPGKGGSP